MLISLRSWEVWLYGLLSAVIGGTATVLGSLVGVPLAHEVGMKVQPLDWQQIKVVAISAGVTTLFAYLAKSPLPRKDLAPKEEEEK